MNVQRRDKAGLYRRGIVYLSSRWTGVRQQNRCLQGAHDFFSTTKKMWLSTQGPSLIPTLVGTGMVCFIVESGLLTIPPENM
jgi:hypothetical protein